MTSEVAILTKSAVAVAADSAVTVGRRRVHRFANKIFSVSDSPPIGLMVYGYAEYSGIPWETIAKIFRKEHEKSHFKTVADCYAAFREFLSQPNLFTKDAQETNLIYFMVSMLTDIERQVRRIPKAKISESLPSIMIRCRDRVRNIDEELEFSPPSLRVFRSEVMDFLPDILPEFFKDREYRVPKYLHSRLCNLAYDYLSSPWLSDYEAGIVLFGFGEDELLPALYSHQLDSDASEASGL